MRRNKNRMELFSIHDHVGMAAHMEKQARKGWLLEKIGNWTWRYRRVEPQNLKFAVTYFPPASVFDPEPTEGERTFHDYCEQAGWKLAASNAQLQVFYTEDSNPVPLETDAILQVENIHAAARKTLLLSQWLMGAIGLFYTILWLVQFFENPIGILSDYGGWFRAVAFSNLLLLCVVELASYYRWHRKAQQVAEETGQLHPTRSHRLFQTVSLTVSVSSLLIWFLVMQSQKTRIIAAVSFLNMTLLILVVRGCQMLMKRLGVSKTKAKVITLAVDFALAFLLMGMLPRWVMSMDLSDKQPVETYEYLGRTREVYNDPLPLTVEDLMDVDPAMYSKVMERQKTPLAALYDGGQYLRKDAEEDLPDLDYRLAICAVPAWTEFCWNGWIEDYQQEFPAYQRLREEATAPWNAEEAYRIVYQDGGEGDWLIRWEDRFVRLTADWELTEEQMGRIAASFLNYAE